MAVLQPIKEKMAAMVNEHPETYSNGVWFSWDNATWHKDISVLKADGMPTVNQLPLPPLSHDLHKVIEHVIGNLKRKAVRHVVTHKLKDVKQIKDAVEKIFYEEIKAESLQADIMSLRDTYKIVASKVEKGGTAGGWPAPHYM